MSWEGTHHRHHEEARLGDFAARCFRHFVLAPGVWTSGGIHCQVDVFVAQLESWLSFGEACV